MKKFCALIIGLAFCNIAGSQDIPIGTWRTHFSYNSIINLADAGNKTFASSPLGIMVFDSEDNSLTTIAKINGLQEGDISALHYNDNGGQLYVGYRSGNLDVITDTEIINLDLTTDSQVNGSKSVNQIFTFGNSIFLITDFGLLRVSADGFEVRETIREIGSGREAVKVYQGVTLGDSLFLATEDGVLATNITNNVNLADPNGWKLFDSEDGLPGISFEVIFRLDNQVVAGASGNGLYIYGGQWTKITTLENAVFKKARTLSTGALIIANEQLFELDNTLRLTSLANELVSNPMDAFKKSTGELFVGDQLNGLVTDFQGSFQSLRPAGPFSNDVFELNYQSGQLFAVPGGFSSVITPLRRDGGYNLFSQGDWESNTSGNQLPEFDDVTDVVDQRRLNRIVLASAGFGLMVINDDGNVQIIDENTAGSPLINTNTSGKNLIVPAISGAQNGLWVLNYGANTPLHFWQDNDQWTSYTLPSRFCIDMVESETQLWMIVDPNRGGGIIVLDKNSGESRILTSTAGEGSLASNTVNALAVDRQGFIWIGTNRGVSVVTDTFSAISGQVDAVEPIFENRPLLRDEEITAIAVDGGDRKWIGTTSGIWLFDPQADKQLLNFTEDNSPLLSDEILDIAIDPISGEVFLATPLGILSYREGATRGDNTHRNVKVFPNPVTQDFQGTVGISGLVRDAQIRITDASGKLIWKTRAAGGTATWQVRDYNGNRAESGIYLIFSADDNGEETYIGKIAVVN
ncbi:T9SS type A sorting domain-containing protein [Fulvivirga sp. M361]|uniref:type IX secretion system anionic LPS delivery protein PorZ n=1 Tax=Fulvivirga sp. M361 TaxID=2594266 RepID=UPI00117AD146|nr:T9SS type A sorting domain-containing protein [Fulvivirga sp. M361]TRX53739.1 T9SS type A sorting domain-containing protein [Fulvivirga sp. M361]